MNKTVALATLVLTFGLMASFDAEAKRLGAGKSAGMQRQNVTAPANNTPGAPANAASPAQVAPAAGAAAAAAPAAAAAKRSWMGPLAGLAAGLGLAALASHLGFGEAFANMLMVGLVIMAVMLVIGLVLRRRAAAHAGSLVGGGGVGPLRDLQGRAEPQMTSFQQSGRYAPQTPGGSLIGSRLTGGLDAAAGTASGTIPAGFDTASFERTARDQFLALQAANDARDLDRLRDYLSPEMFEVVSAEIAERGDMTQETQVFGLQAQVLNVAEEPTQYVVSVRFTGSVREQPGVAPDDLHEVWHLTKERSGFGGWVIAGIQQLD